MVNEVSEIPANPRAHPSGWHCMLDWSEWPQLVPCKQQCEECAEDEAVNG